MIPLLRLLAILPLLCSLVSAGHFDRAGDRHHAARAAARMAIVEKGTIESKMAKRSAGRTLAVRKAHDGQCRPRGAKWEPSALAVVLGASRSVSSSSSVSATQSSVSIAASTISASPMESTTAPWQAPSPSASASPAPTAAPTQAAPPSSGGNTGFTPNGIKAGMSAGDAYDLVKDHIGWWYDWTPNPSGHWGRPIAVPMIWGAGSADHTDSARLQEFKSMSSTPPYIIGYEEPDCAAGSGSAGFDVDTGVALWNSHIAPKGAAGSLLLSPSMCKQAEESGWLQPFQSKISRDWDITNVHINKKDAAGIRKVIDHYWNTYGKPLWVTEFACVDDVNGFTPCTDQQQINSYIYTAVGIFESDSRVAAYAFSNGYGLGDVWPAMKNGQLSESGKAYLAAISQYH